MRKELSKTDILDLIYENPIEVGHWVGFKDLTDIHNEWLKDFLFEDEDQTLQGHRGSYKTTTLSLFFALHIIIKPDETVLFFRKTDTDVKEIIKQTAKILDSGCCRKIIRILYNKELKFLISSNTEIQTNLATSIRGTSQLIGLGIGTSITGKHADIVVTDDIVNLKDRASAAERERTKAAYQELVNVKNRGGRFINTGTPWHKDDAFQLMPDPKKFDCYSTGLMSENDIDFVRDRMSPSLFAANYELKHIAAEDVIFLAPQQGADASMVLNGLMHVDSAFYGEDFTALTIAKIHDGKIYMLGKIWRKHVEDCYPQIQGYYNKFLCSKLWNETNADKGMVAKDLKKLGMHTVTYAETMNKYIKIVTYLKKVWKDVIFVTGTDQDYIDQICEYTDVAEHDDAPDSAASIVRVLYPKIDKEPYKPIINQLSTDKGKRGAR